MARRKSAKAPASTERQSSGKAGRKPGPKTHFILSQPIDMPAADVVAAAAKQGMKLTVPVVHVIRSRHRQKIGSSPTLRGKPARVSAHYRSGSDFVRAQPLETPTKEVVLAAAKVGLKVTENLVRIVRYKMRHAKDAAPGSARGLRVGRPVLSGPSSSVSAAEIEFRRAILAIGVTRAKELLSELEAGIRAILAG
jgi:hypothetical protein